MAVRQFRWRTANSEQRTTNMKISPQWVRDFVDLPVDYVRLADELTLAGVAVEGISGSGENTVFEMEITTNRPEDVYKRQILKGN